MNFVLKVKNPCVFIHIPKVAGLSIRRGTFGTGERFSDSALLDGKYKEYYKFAFVRNPWDRLVSAYEYFRQRGLFQGTLLQFLDVVTDEKVCYRHNFDKTSPPYKDGHLGAIRHHTLPMTHPYNCLKYANFIGRFENLQVDFDSVCDAVGEARRSLPHMNAFSRRPYRDYYNTKILQIVGEYFKRDIEHFGYTY